MKKAQSLLMVVKLVCREAYAEKNLVQNVGGNHNMEEGN
jgi:hypothetical protein